MNISIKLLGAVFAFRIANAILCATFFQPDEFYQSLEVAHRVVFGYGYETWEWRVQGEEGGIRSPLNALLYVPGYYLVKLLGLDGGMLLTLVPKFTQAAVATVVDVFTYKAAESIVAPGYGLAAVPGLLFDLFYNAYAGIRAFSNSTETALTAIALAYWPWSGSRVKASWTRTVVALSAASAAVAVRPSGVLFWIPMGLSLLSRSSGETRVDVFALVATVGVPASVICFMIDSAYYGVSTFTPLNFLRQNILHNISIFYGANAWYFYIPGFAFVNWSLFPTVLLGMFSPPSPNEDSEITARLGSARKACFVTMLGLSLLSHKEYRFLQPLLPLFHVFAARAIVNAWVKLQASSPSSSPTSFLQRLAQNIKMRPGGLIFRTLLAFVPAFYFLQFQYRGQTGVVEYLRQVPVEDLKSVGFLMPCHSTPWQSHLHREHLAPKEDGERMWMITCEPPILGQNATTYVDQSDVFYADPTAYLADRFPANVDNTFPPQPYLNLTSDPTTWQHVWPSHLALFEALTGASDSEGMDVKTILAEKGYKLEQRLWNSRWHEDPRRKGDVLVYSWSA